MQRFLGTISTSGTRRTAIVLLLGAGATLRRVSARGELAQSRVMWFFIGLLISSRDPSH